MQEPVRWQKLVAKYQHPQTWRSVWQVLNSVIPFLLLWYLTYWSLSVSAWLAVGLSILAAGFMVRTFIIFHDCGHGSFFKSQKWNAAVGTLTGILTLTPYHQWRHEHSIHHATAGNLDKRGIGDVYNMTVQEYTAAPWWLRLAYRIGRHPLIMFTIGAMFVFVVRHRLPSRHGGRREHASVWWTNLALAVLAGGLIYAVGLRDFLVVEGLILLFACSAGVWMFFVQHNFAGVYLAHADSWDFLKAGMEGSSFYKLPAVLNWFTGSIGYHHIHHLSPRIPNYRLAECLRENPYFSIRPLTIWESLSCLKYRLVDETTNQLVGFEVLKKPRAA